VTRILLGAGVLVSALAVALRAQAPPQFAVAVEYVEIEARVLDGQNLPVRGLTRDQFQVVEDGVVQNLTAFSSVDLPAVEAIAPNPLASVPAGGFVRPDVATNIQPNGEGRIFLLLIDDQKIDGTRTQEVRRTLTDFIQRSVGTTDLVAVSSLWQSAGFQNFTSDKALLGAAVGRLFGVKLPSPIVESLKPINAGDMPVSQDDVTYTRSKAVQDALLKLVVWMGEVRGGSKSVILVSEGIPPDVVPPDDPFGPLDIQMRQFALDRLAGATRRSSVPIYTLDPRGLTSLAEEGIQMRAVPMGALQNELEASRVALRRLAADTGGEFFATNDFRGAFDQVVNRASTYYVLGYSSTNASRDGKFRRVEIKVNQPGMHVAARRGYAASSSRPPQSPGVSSSLVRAREALISRFPASELPLTMSAAAFRDKGSTSSVAVILEAVGTALELTDQGGSFAAPLQVLVAALDDDGKIKASEAKDIQFRMAPAVFSRVRQHGFRWLSRLNVKPGTYQLRLAAAGSSKQGSVWYDLEVPDFSDGDLAISDLLVTSVARFATPTLRPDPQLANVLPGPPTASREFPTGDELTVFAEVYDNRPSDGREIDVSVRVRTEGGREVFQLTDPVTRERIREARGVIRSITKIPLQVLPGRYVMRVETARHGDTEHRVIREVPFTVVSVPR